MGRPRTVNRKIKDLPRGFRCVDGKWYWRPTDAATRMIAEKLKAGGINTSKIATPIEARRWWEKNVSPKLDAMAPDADVEGTVEELVRRYEAEDLLAFKRAETRAEYEGRIKRIRAEFGNRAYPRTQHDALTAGFIGDPVIQAHLYKNSHRAASANKDVQLLSRIFRLGKSRWGLTAYNPCADITYLPEHARDVYVTDDKYLEVVKAAPPILACMLDISSQTAGRIGSVYTIRLDQVQKESLIIRVGKKKNGKGYIEKPYTWTTDLREAVDKALSMRKVRCKEGVDDGNALFLTDDGKPYTKEAYKSAWGRTRRKLGLKAREITVHDLGRAKTISDADSDEAGQKLAGHEDIKITKRVYRRKQVATTPMGSVGRR